MRQFLLIATLATLVALGGCKEPLPDEGAMPDLSGAETWFNSQPLMTSDLRGKVVLIDFWTYSCVNCLRVIPYVKAWDAKYRDQGLVVIGVHAPEFDFEEDTANVKAAMARLGITYPVVLDNDMNIWNAFKNQYWPAHYFIDVNGRIRYHHFGEGEYEKSEQVIRTLLKDVKDAKRSNVRWSRSSDTASYVIASGEAAAAEGVKGRSPETYIGYLRAARLISTPALKRDSMQTYTLSKELEAHEWALQGPWRITREYGETQGTGASIVYRYDARDVNLVLGPAVSGTSIKFRVLIDGNAPGDAAGMDVDAQGNGVITEHRMYQLIRHKQHSRGVTFTIIFEGSGARVYAFTFG
jgi:thiol-disulfide isomerase/thioredoxin